MVAAAAVLMVMEKHLPEARPTADHQPRRLVPVLPVRVAVGIHRVMVVVGNGVAAAGVHRRKRAAVQYLALQAAAVGVALD